MRMIDHFRTPSQQRIIRWLETNHMGTRFDIIKAIGTNTRSYRHFHALVEDGVIHICGYVGCKNIPVYALCYKSSPHYLCTALMAVLNHLGGSI